MKDVLNAIKFLLEETIRKHPSSQSALTASQHLKNVSNFEDMVDAADVVRSEPVAVEGNAPVGIDSFMPKTDESI